MQSRRFQQRSPRRYAVRAFAATSERAARARRGRSSARLTFFKAVTPQELAAPDYKMTTASSVSPKRRIERWLVGPHIQSPRLPTNGSRFTTSVSPHPSGQRIRTERSAPRWMTTTSPGAASIFSPSSRYSAKPSRFTLLATCLPHRQLARQLGRNGVSFCTAKAVGSRTVIPLTAPEESNADRSLIFSGTRLYCDSHPPQLSDHAGHPAELAGRITGPGGMQERCRSAQTINLSRPNGIFMPKACTPVAFERQARSPTNAISSAAMRSIVPLMSPTNSRN
ncbi:hypothetical protein ACVWW6_008991 [Bradyrhizobium sp. USDA 3311]